MRIAIVIDPWKAPIFRTELDGWEYEEKREGPVIVFAVTTDDPIGLSDVVLNANKRATESRN